MGRFISKDLRQSLRALASVSSMGLAMALAIVIGLGAGYWVDTKLGSEPWGFFIGLGIGIAAGFRNVYIIARRAGTFSDEGADVTRNQDQKGRDQGPKR